jgi:magnesium-protoporphyrin O-methyltransferase
MFGPDIARRELARYRRRGAEGTTRVLIEALLDRGVQDETLLDIGGGVGAIQHELLRAGAARATHVDASQAYLNSSREEAERIGHAERSFYRLGDFVDLAEELDPASVITLDRVICCYPDMRALVSGSARLGTRWYAASYPRETWWIRLALSAMNFGMALFRRGFRVYVHPIREIRSILATHGWQPTLTRRTWMWEIAVFRRVSAADCPRHSPSG